MRVAAVLLVVAWDVGLFGSVGISALVCPTWILGSVLNSAVRRPGWRIALVRVAIPFVTMGVVFANGAVQDRIAAANAARIIAACEEFRAVSGRFPDNLGELTPRYIQAVPRLKYCLDGKFGYWNDGHPILVWHVSGYYRRVYSFEDRRWSFLD